MIQLKINNKIYDVIEAKTKEEKQKGLQGVDALKDNEGMLFYFDSEETVSMTMKSVKFPIDIIFIDEELQVVYVHKGKPNSKEVISIDDIEYVLELNQNSGIKEGDFVEFVEESQPVMKVLFPDGSTQYELWGGERIVSRRETKILISKAKKADKSKDDKDYKSLGKYIFKVFYKQDNRDPEYVKIEN